MTTKPESFKQRLRDLLFERNISLVQFDEDTGINRQNFFYRKNTPARQSHKHCKYIYMAIAYYLNMTVEDLVAGTDAEEDFM